MIRDSLKRSRPSPTLLPCNKQRAPGNGCVSWKRDRALLQPGISCVDDSLSPVCHLQLTEDVGDIVVDGLHTQGQVLRNVVVRRATRDQLENLTLTRLMFFSSLVG